MMFKRSLLSVAVMTAVISSPNTHAFESSPFFEDGNVSGGIYNFTRVRNRKDLEDGKYKENIHHSTALANVEFNSGLAGGFFGVDVGAFGTYDMWNSGSSYDSEFSLRDEKKGKVVNTVSVYKASARLDFDTLQLRAGYLQPSGPGVLGVNWSFVPGTYRGYEARYTSGGFDVAYFWADEYKSPWEVNIEDMLREDGTAMKYTHSLGATYDFGNGFNVLGAFGQGEDFVDLYKLKLGYAVDGLNLNYQYYAADDKDNVKDSANNMYDGLGYQHVLASSFSSGSWSFRGEATYTRAKGNKGAFVFRPTYQSGKSDGAYDVWWDNRSDFNHNGEKAVFAGAWYDFTEKGYAGLTAGLSTAYGWGAKSQDETISTETLKEIGYSLDVGYQFQTGDLKGASVALHVTYFDNKTKVGDYTSAFPNAFQNERDFKLFLMMPFS